MIANFDGQGDSGEVYEIIYQDIDQKYLDFDTPEELKDFIYDGIEKLVDSYGGDWVNNDGGYGNFNINVRNMTIDGNYYQRTVDSYDWQESNLFN